MSDALARTPGGERAGTRPVPSMNGGRGRSPTREPAGRQGAEDQLREQIVRISEAERIVGFGIWTWEIATARVHWSDELHRIYGLRPGEFAGTVAAFVERLHPDDRDRVWEAVSKAIETLEAFAFEERILRPDGEERVLLSQGRVIAGPDGVAQHLVGVCQDVTDRALAERALGTSERRIRAIVENSPSIIVVKDLAGRYLMSNRESGRVLGIPQDELLGRLCTEVFPPEVAADQRVIDQRAASVGEAVYGEAVLVRDDEPRSYVTVTFPLPDENGRPVETCTIATDVTERKERESERRERREWTESIRSALDEDRMLVYAQPVVDLRSGVQTSSELLVRMRPRKNGAEVMVPGAFIPAAERFGLVGQIDAWMVGQALALGADVAPQVNLSAVTICDGAARSEIVRLLRSSPDAAARIVFEITETAAAGHLAAARTFADELTGLGCRLALDDFGTGFGSFTYLRSLPISYIKIDLSFVRGLLGSIGDRRVVKSIIDIARQFELQTIAEGVEDERTLELLRELGADYVQGFHLGRPEALSV